MTRIADPPTFYERISVAHLRVLVDDVAAGVPVEITDARPELEDAYVYPTLIAAIVAEMGFWHHARRPSPRRVRRNATVPPGYPDADVRWIDEVARFPMTDQQLTAFREELLSDEGHDRRRCPSCGRS